MEVSCFYLQTVSALGPANSGVGASNPICMTLLSFPPVDDTQSVLTILILSLYLLSLLPCVLCRALQGKGAVQSGAQLLDRIIGEHNFCASMVISWKKKS